jgi:hypothetical protein
MGRELELELELIPKSLLGVAFLLQDTAWRRLEVIW